MSAYIGSSKNLKDLKYAAATQAAADAQKNAAEKKVRRERAANLEAWLRDMCEIDDYEMPEVLDAFVDPRYTFQTFRIY